MKFTLSVVSLLSISALPVLAAPDSAYTALRVVGTERGKEVLDHVIEVEGKGGVPQPNVWRIVLDDPAARSGVREIEVAHGKIVAEHTPMRTPGSTGTLIDFKKLNLDSAGAFSVVEKEAQKTKLGFDSVDYALKTGAGSEGTPVWVIHVMDGHGHSVGNMSVAADTGAVVSDGLAGNHPDDYSDVRPAPHPQVSQSTTTETTQTTTDYTVHETDHDNLYTGDAEPTPQRQEDDTDTEDTHGLRLGHKIKMGILSAGQSLKNFVTGDSGR